MLRLGGPTGEFEVDGFVSDVGLGMDLRDEGDSLRWTLSHLGTGHRICDIEGSVVEAFAVADEIAACGNWHFTDPEDRHPLRDAVRAVFARHADKVTPSLANLPPPPTHEGTETVQ